MEHLDRDQLATATLTIVMILSGLAFALQLTARSRWALLCVVLAGASLQLFAATDMYLHMWDERYHALVAKHLASHPLTPTLYEDPVLAYDYRNWLGNHIWLHKQPLTLWLMASSIKLFGIHEFAIRLPSVLLSLLAIVMTYVIGNRLGNRWVGLLAAWFYATNWAVWALASGRLPIDHIDSVHMVLVEAAMLVAILDGQGFKKAIAVGALVGLAGLAKSMTSLFVLLAWLPLLLRECSWGMSVARLGIAAIAAALVYAPWQIYVHAMFPQEASWEAGYTIRHVFEVLENHGGTWLYYVNIAPYYFGSLVAVPVVWLCWASCRRADESGRDDRDPDPIGMRVLLLWIAVPYVFFSLARTKMPAYVMVSAPAILVVQALFVIWIWQFARRLDADFTMRRGWRTAVAVLIVGCMVLQPFRRTAWDLKPPRPQLWQPEWAREVRDLANRLAAHGPKTDIFNCERAIEAMFYADIVAYQHLPSADEIARVQERGYRVFVVDDGQVPEDVRVLPGVRVLPRK